MISVIEILSVKEARQSPRSRRSHGPSGGPRSALKISSSHSRILSSPPTGIAKRAPPEVRVISLLSFSTNGRYSYNEGVENEEYRYLVGVDTVARSN